MGNYCLLHTGGHDLHFWFLECKGLKPPESSFFYQPRKCSSPSCEFTTLVAVTDSTYPPTANWSPSHVHSQIRHQRQGGQECQACPSPLPATLALQEPRRLAVDTSGQRATLVIPGCPSPVPSLSSPLSGQPQCPFPGSPYQCLPTGLDLTQWSEDLSRTQVPLLPKTIPCLLLFEGRI